MNVLVDPEVEVADLGLRHVDDVVRLQFDVTLRVDAVLDLAQIHAVADRHSIGSAADQDHLLAMSGVEETARLIDRLNAASNELSALVSGLP